MTENTCGVATRPLTVRDALDAIVKYWLGGHLNRLNWKQARDLAAAAEARTLALQWAEDPDIFPSGGSPRAIGVLHTRIMRLNHDLFATRDPDRAIAEIPVNLEGEGVMAFILRTFVIPMDGRWPWTIKGGPNPHAACSKQSKDVFHGITPRKHSRARSMGRAKSFLG